jgi:hypothetical protein
MTVTDAERVIEKPSRVGLDKDGKPKYYGTFGEYSVCIVVALDEPDLIVTIYKGDADES